jgi:hypothetical protein
VKGETSRWFLFVSSQQKQSASFFQKENERNERKKITSETRQTNSLEVGEKFRNTASKPVFE